MLESLKGSGSGSLGEWNSTETLMVSAVNLLHVERYKVITLKFL